MKKIISLCLIMLIALCFGALALNNTITAVTFTTPANSAYITDSYSFTGTFTGNVSTDGNISVYYNDSFVCADTTGLANVASGTWSCSGSVSSLVDAECVAHRLNVSAYNGTSGKQAPDGNTSHASIYSDATSPTASLVFTHAQLKSGEKSYYTCTVSDSCDTSITSTVQVALTDPKSVVATNLTSTSSYWPSGETREQGTYTSTCSATDDASNVGTSSSATFRVSGTSSAYFEETTVAVAQQTAQKKSLALVIALIAAFLVTAFFVVIGLYFYVVKKK